VDGDGCAVICALAGLGACAGAYGTSVVATAQGAAVVVAEFYDDDVVGLNSFYDLVETAFDCEGARAAAADGFVEDGEGEGVGEIDAPA
jgi:hypothetical protein